MALGSSVPFGLLWSLPGAAGVLVTCGARARQTHCECPHTLPSSSVLKESLMQELCTGDRKAASRMSQESSGSASLHYALQGQPTHGINAEKSGI